MAAATLEGLHEELQALKRDVDVRLTDLQTRILAVEKEASNDKKDRQEATNKMRQDISRVEGKVDSLESLEDANFMAVTHMLGVIARKLGIPKKELQTGDRRGTKR